MLRLEKRPSPSRFWLYATPPVAVLLTMVVGGILRSMLGRLPGVVGLVHGRHQFAQQR